MENIFTQRFKHVALIAPAGKVETKEIALSVELLEKSGLEVKIMPHVFSSSEEDYLAATLKERLEDLHACWQDKSIDLIFCVRGGFGSAQLLPYINWNLLAKRNIPLIGYSDITALHMGMLNKKVATPIAAPMPLVFNEALFENDDKEYTRHFMRLALAESIPAKTQITRPNNENFNIIKNGSALGLPVVASLSVLASLCGTKWFPNLRHKILIIEDLNEDIYKIDRYLTQILQCNVLKECGALFFAQFNNCGEEDQKYELFKNFAKNIKGPVICDFPFGHNFPSISINMRRHLRIEKNGKIFIIDS